MLSFLKKIRISTNTPGGAGNKREIFHEHNSTSRGRNQPCYVLGRLMAPNSNRLIIR